MLPELFSVAGSPDHLRSHAEDGRGPTTTWAADLAARRRIHLLAGSYPEQAGPGRVFFCNSGGEADEGLLKLARLHGMRKAGVPDG